VAECMKVFPVHLGQFAIVFPPEIARIFRNGGWSKRQAREYLQRRAQITARDLRRRPGVGVAAEVKGGDNDLHAIVDSPEGILFIVAGGDAGGFTDLIQPWGGGRTSKAVTRPVKV